MPFNFASHVWTSLELESIWVNVLILVNNRVHLLKKFLSEETQSTSAYGSG